MMKSHFISIFCLSLIFSLFLLNTPFAYALSNKWTQDFETNDGKSTYSLILNSPDTVYSNSNWTVTTYLSVDYMDKLRTFVFYVSEHVTIETKDGKSFTKSIDFGHSTLDQFPERLYPGAIWGPTNFTFDILKENLQLPSSGSMDANIYVTLDISEYITTPRMADPIPVSTSENFSVNTGTVKIISEGNTLFTYIPYVIGLVVAVIIFVGLLISNRFYRKKIH